MTKLAKTCSGKKRAYSTNYEGQTRYSQTEKWNKSKFFALYKIQVKVYQITYFKTWHIETVEKKQEIFFKVLGEKKTFWAELH